MEENVSYPRIIMGLDVSTACIGVSIVKDNGDGKEPEILKLTHISPKVSGNIKGIEALFLRKNIFEQEFLPSVKQFGITDVVIEEPLLSSNNAYTVATLLRFNGMIAECIYRTLRIVPAFISSYDARTYSFPDLLAIRKYDKKGHVYPIKHIEKALKDNHLVLFGAYPFDIDKKTVMMNMVNNKFDNIEWIYNKKGEIRKENYDACDSLICALAYINFNRNGFEEPQIESYSIEKDDRGNTIVEYAVKMWGQTFAKTINL